MNMINVYLIGAKSIGQYGGYESFVNKLTEYHQNNHCIKYHIACKANGQGCMDESKLDGVKRISDTEFEYHNARCFKIHCPNIGPVQAIYYDVRALSEVCKHVKENHADRFVVYVMACRIGPWAGYFQKKIHALGGKMYLNPDGHEWKRLKWSKPIRDYWKYSEKLMVKHSDLVICDSKNIEKYIKSAYSNYNPKTTYIAYGAETHTSKLKDNDSEVVNWYNEKEVRPGEYYLVVGRFVPENNYEAMIREFMISKTQKDLVIITNLNGRLSKELEQKLNFKSDIRIKFVGTVYNEELLKKIRENAYGYFHGHEVGGTNPSLLEALGSTKLNLLLKVGFNEEVAEDAALYWTKENGSLASLIEYADLMPQEDIKRLGAKAKERIKSAYSWEFIAKEYAEKFCVE